MKFVVGEGGKNPRSRQSLTDKGLLLVYYLL